MTRNEFILHDAIDYIDLQAHKAALMLSYLAEDYTDPDPIDPDHIIAEQDNIRTLVNISLDYLHQVRSQCAEAMNATKHSTDTDSDHTNAQTEPDSSSHSADHDRTEASTTHDSTSDHTAHDTNGKSAAPMTAEQAAERIQYISIEAAMDSTATAYKAAILHWVNEDEPETPAQDMTFYLAFASGLMEGRRQERQRRRNRQNAANG